MIYPRRACTARVTVLGLSVCLSVCPSVCLSVCLSLCVCVDAYYRLLCSSRAILMALAQPEDENVCGDIA